MPELQRTPGFPNKYFWRALCLTFVFGLLMVTPAHAQTGIAPATPTPVPVLPISPDAVDRVVGVATDAVERIGITAFVPAIVSIIALLIVLIGGYLLLRVGAKPLLDILRDERNARKEERDERIAAQRDLTVYRERQADAEDRRLKAQERQAEADEKLAERVISMETKTEASERTENAVTKVNRHTDEAHADTLKEIRLMIESVIKAIANVPQSRERRDDGTEATADLTIPNAQRILIKANEEIKKLEADAPQTNSVHEPDAD